MTTDSPRDLFSEFMEDQDIRRSFEREWLAEQIVLQLEQKMDELGVSRSTLAERLGCTPPNVTKLLRRGTNLTLGKIVDLALAIGHRFLPPALVPQSDTAPWEAAYVAPLPVQTVKAWAGLKTESAEGSISAVPPDAWLCRAFEGTAEANA